MRIRVLLALMLISIGLYGQKPPLKVPEAVAKVISTTYPGAAELEWSEKKGRYKADFKIGKTDHKVWMDAAGVVVKHEYEIKKADLTKAIQDSVAKDFAGYTIGDCEKTEENNTATYKVELKNAKGKKKVDFTSEGKVIEKKS